VARIGTGKRGSTYCCLGACSQAGRRTMAFIALSNRDFDVFDYLPPRAQPTFSIINIQVERDF
jgi:hypothetical protein